MKSKSLWLQQAAFKKKAADSDNFPKVLAQKKKAFLHKQKVLKAFEPFSKALLKKELSNQKIKK